MAVQYRLGMFGFLSTEDANALGNYGLGDAKLALKWLQQHIEAFGGDSDKITLMGHGAGSMLVSAMMLDSEVRSMLENDKFYSVLVVSHSYGVKLPSCMMTENGFDTNRFFLFYI